MLHPCAERARGVPAVPLSCCLYSLILNLYLYQRHTHFFFNIFIDKVLVNKCERVVQQGNKLCKMYEWLERVVPICF